MNTMRYKGYSARIEYSDDDGLLIGHIAGIGDIVGFHAEDVPALREAFQQAVDDYLDACQRFGRAPQKPWSGKLSLRMPPELHALAALKAEVMHKSLNQWVCEVIDEAVQA